MKDLFNDLEFDTECPNCNRNIIFKAKDIGKTITCRYCSCSITLEDDSSFSKGVKEVNKSFNDLEKTLENFGK